jgi:hypothetical protein
MDAFVAAQDAAAPAALSEAWNALEGAWEDRARHDRFAEAVAAAEAYSWAARRYRSVLRSRSDDAIAPEYLAKLSRMAEARLSVSATPKGTVTKPFGGTMVAVAILALLVIGALAYAGIAAR